MMDKEYLNNPFQILIHGKPKTGRTEFVYPKADDVVVDHISDPHVQADLYAKGTFRDGNVRQSKRKSRLNKKMQNRRNRRG